MAGRRSYIRGPAATGLDCLLGVNMVHTYIPGYLIYHTYRCDTVRKRLSERMDGKTVSLGRNELSKGGFGGRGRAEK